MYRVVKTHYIDMAHRIKGHEGKCARVHGHTWMIEVSLSSNELDDLGMVIDFGKIKELFFAEIDRRFDHQLVFGGYSADHPMPLGAIHGPMHVTCEGFAKFFYDMAVSRLPEHHRVDVDYVRVYEQLHPTVSYAEYMP